MFGPACSIGAGILTVWPISALQRGDRLAVAANGQLRGLALPALSRTLARDRLILADDAEPRRLDEFDPAVALALVAGDEHVQRRMEAQRFGLAGMSCAMPSVTMIAPPTRSGGVR